MVEDAPRTAALLRRGLEEEGYAVDVADTGPDALWYGTENSYDAIVLDLMLPGLDGVEVCRRLREHHQWAPVLMLTARHEITDRVRGLDAGADDYLVKPFALEELLARLRALLRRASGGGTDVFTVGDLVLNTATREVRRAEKVIELTKTEFDLLELLMQNAGVVLNRSVIYERIWGYDFETSSNSLDVYIGYLRRKTEVDGLPRLIHTVRGVGYVARES